MIKKLEAWLRRIVAEEVAKARDDFRAVDSRFSSDVKSIEAEFTEVGIAFKRFEEAFEHEMTTIENTLTLRLEESVKAAQERIEKAVQSVTDTISKDLDHWKAGEDTRKQDEALRKKK